MDWFAIKHVRFPLEATPKLRCISFLWMRNSVNAWAHRMWRSYHRLRYVQSLHETLYYMRLSTSESTHQGLAITRTCLRWPCFDPIFSCLGWSLVRFSVLWSTSWLTFSLWQLPSHGNHLVSFLVFVAGFLRECKRIMQKTRSSPTTYRRDQISVSIFVCQTIYQYQPSPLDETTAH